MNKAITITLNETAFEIEDKAYEKLKEYLSSVEKYFSKEEAKEEIIKDIENNFASKLEDKLSTRKQKIVLEKDIEELIKIIGEVEDFESESKKEEKDNYYKEDNYTYKKLYRNPDDVVLAGVCSGLGSYLGIEANLVRVIFVIFTLFTGFFPGFIIYFILWAILPIAETGSQKLEMDGEIINLKNLKEKIYQMKDDIKKATMNENNRNYVKQKVKTFKREFKDAVRKNKRNYREDEIVENKSKLSQREDFISLIIKIILLIIGISFIISAISGFIGISIAASIMLFNPEVILHSINIAGVSSNYIQILSVLGLLTALIPLIFMLIAGTSLIKRRNHFNVASSLFLLVLWVFIISSLVFFSIRIFKIDSISYPRISINTPIVNYENLNARETSYDLSNFDSINIQGPYSINIKKSDTFSVKVKAEDYILEKLDVSVNKGEIKIKSKDILNTGINNVSFDIELPSIKRIDAKGMTKVNLEGFDSIADMEINLDGASSMDSKIYAKNLKLNINGFSELRLENINNEDLNKIKINTNGASRIYLNNINSESIELVSNGASYENISGITNSINIDINGASNFDSINLKSKNAKLILDGASISKLSVENYMSTKLNGASNLEYYGEPQISQIVKGLSVIKKYDESMESVNVDKENIDNNTSSF